MDVASTAFKKHRVERIIDMKSRPLCCVGAMYWLEFLFIIIWWLLSRNPGIAETLKGSAGFGWRHRPAFLWQDPDYSPSAKAKRNAEEALVMADDGSGGDITLPALGLPKSIGEALKSAYDAAAAAAAASSPSGAPGTTTLHLEPTTRLRRCS